MAESVKEYSIRDIISYRSLNWVESDEFFFLTEIPTSFEPFIFDPNYYSFGMIEQGLIDISVNSNRHAITPDSLLIYRPQQTIQIHQIPLNTKGAFILFTKKFLDYLNENIFSVKSHSFLSLGIDSHIQLTQADSEKLFNVFKKIIELVEMSSKQSWELTARNLASALIYETDSILKDYIDTSKIIVNHNDIIYNKFKNLVFSHFISKRNVVFYSEALCISVNHLYAVVKKTSGLSPSFVINSHIITESKKLLNGTANNINEIAQYLNFSDSFSFSKYFKKHTGLTPSQYRRTFVSEKKI